MSELNLTEYVSKDKIEPAPVQVLEYSDSPTQSKPFLNSTKFIRLLANSDCFLSFGPDPEAGINCTLLVGGETEVFGVIPGHKLSVVQA